MKIVILGAEARYRAYQPAMPFIQQQELVFLDKDSTEAEILAAGADAEVLFVDAITVVSAALMEHMPCLRLIHSDFSIILLYLIGKKQEGGHSIRELISKQSLPIRWGLYMIPIVLIIIAGAYGPGWGVADFIYAKF